MGWRVNVLNHSGVRIKNKNLASQFCPEQMSCTKKDDHICVQKGLAHWLPLKSRMSCERGGEMLASTFSGAQIADTNLSIFPGYVGCLR